MGDDQNKFQQFFADFLPKKWAMSKKSSSISNLCRFFAKNNNDNNNNTNLYSTATSELRPLRRR